MFVKTFFKYLLYKMNKLTLGIFIFIIIILFLTYVLLFNKNIENMTSSEAIQNVASVYNSDRLTVKNLTVTDSINFLPKGVIVAWTENDPPEGWTLCNGLNGTPDLRGRFIMGYDSKHPLLSAGGNPDKIKTTIKSAVGTLSNLPPYYALTYIMKL